MNENHATQTLMSRKLEHSGTQLTDYLATLPQAQAGTVFNYNTAESNLLGEVLERRLATGDRLHECQSLAGLRHGALG